MRLSTMILCVLLFLIPVLSGCAPSEEASDAKPCCSSAESVTVPQSYSGTIISIAESWPLQVQVDLDHEGDGLRLEVDSDTLIFEGEHQVTTNALREGQSIHLETDAEGSRAVKIVIIEVSE